MTNNEPDYDNLYFEEKKMIQKIFDTDNAEDMAQLWSILPESITKLTPIDKFLYTPDNAIFTSGIIKIDWHDKREITRPIQEATEADVGKLCYFWEGKDFAIGILKGIGDDSSLDIYCMEDSRSGVWFAHCRRLTETDIEELCR